MDKSIKRANLSKDIWIELIELQEDTTTTLKINSFVELNEKLPKQHFSKQNLRIDKRLKAIVRINSSQLLSNLKDK